MEIAIPVSMLGQLPALAAAHPDWARVLQSITGSWGHRDQTRAALDAALGSEHALVQRGAELRVAHQTDESGACRGAAG